MLLLTVLLAAAPDAGTTIIVSGTASAATIERGRWGGVATRPEEEQARFARNEESLRAPRPLSRAEFAVLRGKENRTSQKPVATFTTNTNGRFSVALPTGTYCVIRADRRRDRTGPTAVAAPNQYVDADCAEREARQCDALWHITSASRSQSIVVHLETGGGPHCWRGPSPP